MVSLVSFMGADDLAGAEFVGADLHGAWFRESDLRGVRVRGADLTGAELDGGIDGLRVNGVEVAPLVEAERRDGPVFIPSMQFPLRQCLWIIMNEEWHHHRYATRDLDALGATIGPPDAGAAT